jgi:Ca-activated chloride channel family protein
MNFLYPNILWLTAIVPLIVLYYIFVARRKASLTVSTIGGKRAPRPFRYWLRPLPIVLRMVAVALFIVALARPVNITEEHETTTDGIDIVMAMDISGSMLARDFTPDRLTSAKHLAAEFVANRRGDRIAVVAFAGEAFTQAPLTSDQAVVETMLSRLRSGVVEDGTAIGNGLATAVNRLRESGAKSKVVILLTDGVNNRGQISPLMAAEIARDMGIKVYTIGVGTRGRAPYPAVDMFGNQTTIMADVEIDEELLREISSMTGGAYYRAVNDEALRQIYAEINELETSKVQVTNYQTYDELFLLWALLGLLLLGLEFIFDKVVLNRLP